MRYHPAHGLLSGAVLLGRVERCQMRPVCGQDPLCYPQARAALHATPKALVHPAVVGGARPSALRLRCHRAHGMINSTKLLGHAHWHLVQPVRSFYRQACPDSCALQPQIPPWRRWTGVSIRAQIALAPHPWLEIRLCATWECVRMPSAWWVRWKPSLLPAGPGSAACSTQDPY